MIEPLKGWNLVENKPWMGCIVGYSPGGRPPERAVHRNIFKGMTGMKLVRVLGAVVAAVWICVASAGAQAGALSQDEVKALTIKAANLIAVTGIEGAEKAFARDGEFKFGEIYVNVIDLNGNWVIYPPNPANKGKTILKFIDEDGRMLGEEILAIGRKGEGWTQYRWRNPATGTIQPKVTYVKKVPGKDYIAYIGVYK